MKTGALEIQVSIQQSAIINPQLLQACEEAIDRDHAVRPCLQPP